MYIFLAVIIFWILVILTVLNLPVFGALPKSERSAIIKKLPYYKNSAFQNLAPTPMYPEGVTIFTILKAFFKKNSNRRPGKILPSVKPDFSATQKAVVTWFGHSSYLLQVDGYNILVDPVFSAVPSPFSFLGSKNFAGTDFINAENLPSLDVVLLTHDHYDHLDYPTIKKIKNKTMQFITSIGVGAHLEKWKIDKNKIHEMSWGDTFTALPGLIFTATTARHFSGRTFKRNQSLWSGFVLQTKENKIYLGGDSGYESHFKKIGNDHGPFDLAILECGQYNKLWPNIHMFPEQVVQASIDLKAKVLLPVHWGKFTLSLHNWDDPIIRVVNAAAEKNLNITTPMLGEQLIINENYPSKHWWTN